MRTSRRLAPTTRRNRPDDDGQCSGASLKIGPKAFLVLEMALGLHRAAESHAPLTRNESSARRQVQGEACLDLASCTVYAGACREASGVRGPMLGLRSPQLALLCSRVYGLGRAERIQLRGSGGHNDWNANDHDKTGLL
jgi:hypothetical protein